MLEVELRPLDPLVGRDNDLNVLLDEVGQSRLVTLTGPGGSGKTRLAEAAIASLRASGRQADLVDLSMIEDAELVGPTAMAALRLECPPDRDPLEVVVDRLSDGERILGLDNLEQIDGVGEVVSRVLAGAPRVRIIATSRRPLGVRGEVECAVQPLELPDKHTAAAVKSSAAGVLFLSRARALGQLGALDELTARDVATLLRRIDGLPLAIELAAARTRILTPREILRRLDEQGPVAIDAHKGDRHRSLAAILEWTIGLLSAEELETLEAVAVCAGFDLEMAQALAPDVDVIATTESLVALGLIARAATNAGPSRFRLLETIRSGVLHRSSGARLALLQQRHADRCETIAVDWHASAIQAGPELVDRFDSEGDNMRRALDHFERAAPLRGLSLIHYLEGFWETRGRQVEGYMRFQRLANLATEPSVELARASASVLLAWIGDDRPPRERADLAIEMARQVNDDGARVRALYWRGVFAVNDGDIETARRIAAELATIDSSGLDERARLEAAELTPIVAGAVHGRASDQHVDLLRAFLAQVSEAGWRPRQARTQINLANSLLLRREYGEATDLARQAVAACRDLHRTGDQSLALCALASGLAWMGRSGEAVDALVEASAIAVEVGFLALAGEVQLAGMCVANVIGQPLLCARLWGCIGHIAGSGGGSLSPLDRELASIALDRARKSVSPVAFELAIRAGAATEPFEMVRDMLAVLDATPPVRKRPVALSHGALTSREVEIFALVGAGRSDPEIAEALFISPKTASVHVANIKGKLGLESRLEIALRARDLGLVSDES